MDGKLNQALFSGKQKSKQSELKRRKWAGCSSDRVVERRCANSEKQKATQSCGLTCPVWPEAAL